MIKVKLVKDGVPEYPFCIIEDGGTECIFCPITIEVDGSQYSISPGPTSTVIVYGDTAGRYKELFKLCKELLAWAEKGVVPEELFRKLFGGK